VNGGAERGCPSRSALAANRAWKFSAPHARPVRCGRDSRASLFCEETDQRPDAGGHRGGGRQRIFEKMSLKRNAELTPLPSSMTCWRGEDCLGSFAFPFEVFTPLSKGCGAEDDGRVWKTGGLAG